MRMLDFVGTPVIGLHRQGLPEGLHGGRLISRRGESYGQSRYASRTLLIKCHRLTKARHGLFMTPHLSEDLSPHSLNIAPGGTEVVSAL